MRTWGSQRNGREARYGREFDCFTRIKNKDRMHFKVTFGCWTAFERSFRQRLRCREPCVLLRLQLCNHSHQLAKRELRTGLVRGSLPPRVTERAQDVANWRERKSWEPRRETGKAQRRWAFMKHCSKCFYILLFHLIHTTALTA